VKYCQKFRLGGMKFDSDFQISRKKESIVWESADSQ
jgi:hypothetical protein